MQLVLAIDADRRQADQLAALVRGRLAVELVQASDAGEALTALGERVPDLIMTSPLLSPFDEGVVAEYLRELGPAGAHVQTLRIPVLGVSKRNERSVFSFGWKRRTEPAPGACDPKSYFADEIALYLARAAEERQANEAAAVKPVDFTQEIANDRDSDDSAPTYVPAYEPESYASEWSAGYSEASAQATESTPIYVAPESTRLHEETPDGGPEPAHDFTDYREPAHAVVPRDTATFHLPGVIDNGVPEPLAELHGRTEYHEPAQVAVPQDSTHDLSQSDELTPVTHQEAAPSRPAALPREAERLENKPQPDAGWQPSFESQAGVTPQITMSVHAEERVDHTLPAIDEPTAHIEPAVSIVEEQPAVTLSPTMAHEAAPAVAPLPGSAAPKAMTASEPEPLVDSSPMAPVEAERTAVPARAARRTPSFEAALAAIRNAWGKPRRSASTSILPRPDDRIEAVPSPVVKSIAPMSTDAREAAASGTQQPVSEPEEPVLETRGALEVDLTCDIDALQPEPAAETVVGHNVEVGTPEDDVYELSASPALHDLESDLAAAAPPRAIPEVLPEVEVADSSHVATQRHGSKRTAKKAQKSADKQREGKLAPPAKQAEPGKAAQPNSRSAQDEWGLFDPDRCGFAAVVQKLNEVTDDEEDPKANRTTVRVISYR